MENGNTQKSVKYLLIMKRVSLLAVSAVLLGTVAFLVFHLSPAHAARSEKAPEVAFHGVAEADYQNRFTQIAAMGYRPVWVNAFTVGSQTYFNAIFHPADGTLCAARHGM